MADTSTTLLGGSIADGRSKRHPGAESTGCGRSSNRLRRALDGLLCRDATRAWCISVLVLLAVGATMRTLAWLAFPVFTTPDANGYCEVLHSLDVGEAPNLLRRNLGYPLFLYLCKLLPFPLYRSVPFVQHLLALLAAVAVAVWMRRRWGVGASLLTAALLLVNSSHAAWSHFAQPNALLCSVMPLVVMASLAGVSLKRWKWIAVSALGIVLALLTREETVLLAVLPPVLALLFLRRLRKRSLGWIGLVAVLCLSTMSLRVASNAMATGAARYSDHMVEVLAWRTLHEKALVAPPRSEKLEALYEAALANGARWRDGYLHIDDLYRTARGPWGMHDVQVAAYMGDCIRGCVWQRPGRFVATGLAKMGKLWLRPELNVEWQAFRQSNPAAFAEDAARLAWAHHARAEFPTTYAASVPQSLFRALAVLRPGETFAMKPLLFLFAIGSCFLLMEVGTAGRPLTRIWFLGLAGAIVTLTAFYGGIAEADGRYRMSMEWAFFAVASLGVFLPLREIRRRLPPPPVAQELPSYVPAGTAQSPI